MSYIPPSDSQYILNASGTTINPATDETVLLLRRMVQLLTPIATQDTNQRQRISLDAAPVAVTVAQSTATQLNANVSQATASNLNATVVQATAANLNTNIGSIGSVDPRFQFVDTARNAFANGIRQNLNFS
jgi:hypothetical protein